MIVDCRLSMAHEQHFDIRRLPKTPLFNRQSSIRIPNQQSSINNQQSNGGK